MINIPNPFGPYKDKHLGESAIFYGSGPTIMDFSTSADILKVGLNEQIYLDLDLDYWFMGDTFPRNPNKFINCFDDYNEYKPKKAKFVRYQLWGERGRMPLGMKHATYYTCTLGGSPDKCLFSKDISKGSLVGVASISFETLQFMLFAGIQKIYLVGHDCDYTSGTFRTEFPGQHSEGNHMLSYWKKVKIWINKNYPDVEIYSVSPVALQIFPEVRAEDIEC